MNEWSGNPNCILVRSEEHTKGRKIIAQKKPFLLVSNLFWSNVKPWWATSDQGLSLSLKDAPTYSFGGSSHWDSCKQSWSFSIVTWYPQIELESNSPPLLIFYCCCDPVVNLWVDLWTQQFYWPLCLLVNNRLILQVPLAQLLHEWALTACQVVLNEICWSDASVSVWFKKPS